MSPKSLSPLGLHDWNSGRREDAIHYLVPRGGAYWLITFDYTCIVSTVFHCLQVAAGCLKRSLYPTMFQGWTMKMIIWTSEKRFCCGNQ